MRDPQQPHGRTVPDERTDRVRRRPGQDLDRVRELLHVPAAREHRDPVAKPDRLVDVVRHEHDRGAELALDPPELGLQPTATGRVDGTERLVHEQDGRVRRERPRHADTLLLAARQLVRVALRVAVRREADEIEELAHPALGALTVPAQQAGDDRDVLRDRPVREEAHVLDHVAHRAP